MTMVQALIHILVFPGLIFLSVLGLAAEFVDRKFYARFQNRKGPPWFQTVADLLKLISKESLIPEDADRFFFRLMPLLALSSTVCASLLIPLWSHVAWIAFEGDVIVGLYLLTIPTMTFFLAGWYSRSVFSMIGAVRTIVQLFAYEVPLFLSILAPAMLADTWSFSGISVFYAAHPWLLLFNIPALCVAFIALLGKLEKVPFDIPEAETEIVAGTFTEYGGRLLAFFRLTIDVEMVVGASLIAAMFFPFGLTLSPGWGFLLYLVKVILIVEALSLARTLFARLRLDQMIAFCWKYLAPVALAQVLVDLILKQVVTP